MRHVMYMNIVTHPYHGLSHTLSVSIPAVSLHSRLTLTELYVSSAVFFCVYESFGVVVVTVVIVLVVIAIHICLIFCRQFNSYLKNYPVIFTVLVYFLSHFLEWTFATGNTLNELNFKFTFENGKFESVLAGDDEKEKFSHSHFAARIFYLQNIHVYMDWLCESFSLLFSRCIHEKSKWNVINQSVWGCRCCRWLCLVSLF